VYVQLRAPPGDVRGLGSDTGPPIAACASCALTRWHGSVSDVVAADATGGNALAEVVALGAELEQAPRSSAPPVTSVASSRTAREVGDEVMPLPPCQ
jgi:hypothetical protein